MTVAVQGGSVQGGAGRGRSGPIGRIKKSYNKHWYAWAMVAPVVLVLVALVLIPLIRGIYLTFTDATSENVGRTIGVNHIPDSFKWVGLQHYQEILSGADGQFWPHFVWTIFWTAACVTLHYGIGLSLAMMLNRKMRGRTVYRILLILPWAVPTFVTVFSWRLILADDGGILNTVLGAMHLPEPGWLSDTTWQRVAAIGVNTWVGVPFMMLSLLGGLQAVPAELYEAAEMDGATPWQRFRHITLPGLRPVSATVILLGTIWTFNQFNVIFLLFGATGGEDTQILITWAYRLGFGQTPRDYAGAATYGVLVLSMLIVFATFYRRWQARGEQAVLR
ncbi:sugar ABC transporter permease [Streptomyces sp. NPDC051322]|uniref:carbohydrate ABC transporter permease n=1 Tax=Streptomyces sp. NPDC051322 TaxID=3154645 RepID=UPI0034500F1E